MWAFATKLSVVLWLEKPRLDGIHEDSITERCQRVRDVIEAVRPNVSGGAALDEVYKCVGIKAVKLITTLLMQGDMDARSADELNQVQETLCIATDLFPFEVSKYDLFHPDVEKILLSAKKSEKQNNIFLEEVMCLFQLSKCVLFHV